MTPARPARDPCVAPRDYRGTLARPTLEPDCNRCFGEGACGALGAAVDVMKLANAEGAQLTFLASWSPSPNKIAHGYHAQDGVHNYGDFTRQLAIGASNLVTAIRNTTEAKQRPVSKRPKVAAAFQSSYECMVKMPHTMASSYIEDDRHYRGGVGDTLIALTVLGTVLNLDADTLLQRADDVASHLHAWFQLTDYPAKSVMTEHVIRELVHCTAHESVIKARLGEEAGVVLSDPSSQAAHTPKPPPPLPQAPSPQPPSPPPHVPGFHDPPSSPPLLPLPPSPPPPLPSAPLPSPPPSLPSAPLPSPPPSLPSAPLPFTMMGLACVSLVLFGVIPCTHCKGRASPRLRKAMRRKAMHACAKR